MLKRAAAAAVITALLLTAAGPGCAERRHADVDARMAVVYAELMLLHEPDNAGRTLPDSLYRRRAADVLARNGTNEQEFRQRSELLMRDDHAWREFLGRVSLVFDSIKTARFAPPPQAAAGTHPPKR